MLHNARAVEAKQVHDGVRHGGIRCIPPVVRPVFVVIETGVKKCEVTKGDHGGQGCDDVVASGEDPGVVLDVIPVDVTSPGTLVVLVHHPGVDEVAEYCSLHFG